MSADPPLAPRARAAYLHLPQNQRVWRGQLSLSNALLVIKPPRPLPPHPPLLSTPGPPGAITHFVSLAD